MMAVSKKIFFNVLLWVIFLSLSTGLALAAVDWNNFRVFTGTTAPYASNGPGCRGFGGSGTTNTIGQGCSNNNAAYDLGAVWADMDSNYLAWQVIALNLTNAGVCGGSLNTSLSGMNQWGVTIEFNADSNTSTGCRMPNQTSSGDMCYPGADYRLYIYGDNSTKFQIYNRSLSTCGNASVNFDSRTCFQIGNASVNSKYNLSYSITCAAPYKIKLAINRSAITSLVGMTFQTNSFGGMVGMESPVDMLGGFDSNNFNNASGAGGFVDNMMFGGSKDMMFESQHPCRTITSQGNCTSSTNVTGSLYNCFWDSFPNTCNPDFRSGFAGSAGMTCSDFCGSCNTTATCLAGGKGKCQVITAPTHLPPGVTAFNNSGTDSMCVEDMTKFQMGSDDSCDDDCHNCYSSSTCGNSTYPNPIGTGAGCQWVSDTSFGRSWCDLSTAQYNFNCAPTNFERCLNQTGCVAVGGNWSVPFNMCYNASTELCFDGTDNDADNIIDCMDTDCSKDSACGGDMNLLTDTTLINKGGANLNGFDAMRFEMFKEMDPSPPVDLATDGDDSLRRDMDIISFSVKDMGDSLGMGLGVTSMSGSLLCDGVSANMSSYYYVVDSDNNASTGCNANLSGTVKGGFEYQFEYLIRNNGTGGPLEVRRGYRCFNSNFSLFPAKLAGAPAMAEFGNQKMACSVNNAILAVDKDDIGNPRGTIRFMAASSDNVTLGLSTANDTIMGTGNNGIYYTFGSVDFKPNNCFENPMACGTAFSVIGGGKFMPFEDCFPSSGDEDLDGLTNCADSDCMMAPWCSNTDYTTGDTTAPSVSTNKAETFRDFVFLHWVTNEPSNATVTLHTSCSNSTAYNRFNELGGQGTFDDYRPWHDLAIRNNTLDSGGTAVTLNMGTIYYYKLRACDKAGNCGTSGCLNFTTASSASTVQYKFDFTPPTGNALVQNTTFQLWNGTAYESMNAGTTNNRSNYLTDGKLKLEDPIGNWSIELNGINLAQAANFNMSAGGLNVSNASGRTYVGLGNQKYLEMVQTLGAKNITLQIPGTGTVLSKCSENNLSDCNDVTGNATLLESVNNASGTYVKWNIPISLGFSTYTVLGAENVTYNLTFTNLTSINQVINATFNFTYTINITNNENVTRVYNITVNTTNSSGFTSGVSTWANGTLMSGSNWLVLNLSTNASFAFNIVINGTAAGTYLSNVFATLYHNASIRLNSSDDIGYITTAVDVTGPSVNLVSPANNSWSNDNTTDFTFNFTDAYSAAANCTLYTNYTLNNATRIVTNNTNTILTANNSLMEGAWTWNVTCVDSSNNIGQSIVRIVNIDTVKPIVSDVKPANGTWINTSTFNFNFSYGDASPTATCVLYVDSSSANSTIASNNTNTTLGATLTDGIKSWQVNCTDNATNMANSTLWVANVDATNPAATINSVNSRTSSGLWTNNASLVINFTANDTNIVNWTLIVFNSTSALLINWTDTVNNLSAVLNYTVAINGTYYVNLTAIDNRSHLTSTQFTIGVDTNTPTATINKVNGQATLGWTNNRTLLVNITALETVSNLSSWNVTIYNSSSGASVASNKTHYTNMSGQLVSFSALSGDGTYTVNLTVLDNASNQGADTFTIYVDATNPTAVVNNVNNKSSNGWTPARNLLISFNGSDSNIKNWTLAVYNGSWILLRNWTDTSSNISANLSYNVSADGTYYVNITAIDNATNSNQTSFTIIADATNPAVNNVSITGVTATAATLSVNASDTTSGIANCTYNLSASAGNGTLNLSSGLYTSALSSLTASTSYNVTFTCMDNATNTNSSSYNFNTSAAASNGTSSSSSSSSSGGSGSLNQLQEVVKAAPVAETPKATETPATTPSAPAAAATARTETAAAPKLATPAEKRRKALFGRAIGDTLSDIAGDWKKLLVLIVVIAAVIGGVAYGTWRMRREE